MVTTPPLAVPPVLRQAPETGADVLGQSQTAIPAMPAAALPTSEPAGEQTPFPSAAPVELALPTTASTTAPQAATAEPPTPVPVAATDTQSTAEGTQPAEAGTQSAPATTSAATPPQAAVSGGGQIDLGDFDVVNLVTGENQNIAELAPSGPAMLWFWAPH